MNVIRKYRQFDLVILIDQFAIVGGVLQSVIGYYKYKNANGDKVLLLSRAVPLRVIKHLFVLLFSPRILVNSLSAFQSWLIIFILLLRKDAIIYFHESETAINSFKKKSQFKYLFLSKILSRNKIACISKLQQKYLQDKFNANTELLYNYSPINIILPKKKGRKIILMAGYLMERKGVSFYSKLADYVVNELELPWDFYWAGGKGSSDKMYFSENVTWLGDVTLMDTLYPQIDAFLLASKDEPFGLVCVEALKYYKNVVAYKMAGASELLATIKGCRVYDSYELDAVVEALKAAFEETIDTVRVDYIIKNILSLESFVGRIDQLFQVNSYA